MLVYKILTCRTSSRTASDSRYGACIRHMVSCSSFGLVTFSDSSALTKTLFLRNFINKKINKFKKFPYL